MLLSTIGNVVRAIPGTVNRRCVIYIKSAIYQENVGILMPNITIVGDGMRKTLSRSRHNNDDGYAVHDSGAVGMY